MVLAQWLGNSAADARRSLLLSFCAAFAGAALVGCGATANQTQNTGTQDTAVTILATSTANDQLFQYSMTINSLTLTSQSGKTVNLLSSPLYVEFMHLNGTPEPLATIIVPNDAYGAATVSIGPAAFTCATTGPDGAVATDMFLYSPVPAADITVSLPSQIQITGGSMLLTLNLLVSQSESYASCYNPGGLDPYSITPTFSVNAAVVSGSGANSRNGELTALEGIIDSVNSATGSLAVNSDDGSNYAGPNPLKGSEPDLANGPIWQIAFNASTVFQGIANPSDLVPGLAVDMDAAIQPDGSLLATRIAVYDTNPMDTSLWVVPALYEDDSNGPRMFTGEREQLGPVAGGDGAPIYYPNSQFQIWQGMSNIASLPFQPSFTGANMVAGQNIEPTFHESSYGDSSMGPAPSTITLMPQTINGTVGAVGSKGGFTTYTVTLAPYDLFPALAVQPDQTTLLTDPSTVVVYADTNTQMLNTNPIAVGSVVRFYGIVFNDNGTLRMDCAQIHDGVPE